MATRKAFKIIGLVELALLLVAGGVAIGLWWKERKQSPPPQPGFGECIHRARLLAEAAYHYAENHDWHLPESLDALVEQQGWDKSILVPTMVNSPTEPAFDFLLAGEHLSLLGDDMTTPMLQSHHISRDGKRIVAFADGHTYYCTDDELKLLYPVHLDHRIRVGRSYSAAKYLVERAGLERADRWPCWSWAYNLTTDSIELHPGQWLIVGHSLISDYVTALAICTQTKNGDGSEALESQTIRSIEFPPDHSVVVQYDLPVKP